MTGGEKMKALGALIGRVLLVLIFVNSGIGKIGNLEGTAQYMAQHGMPYIPSSWREPFSWNW